MARGVRLHASGAVEFDVGGLAVFANTTRGELDALAVLARGALSCRAFATRAGFAAVLLPRLMH